MKIRPVSTLKGGERLSEPVITEEKEILIPKGTVLKPEYLDLLAFLGIEAVSVEDPFAEAERPHWILSEEKTNWYIDQVKDILEGHIYQEKHSLIRLKPLSEEIVEDILQADEEMVIDVQERNGNLYDHTIMVTMLSVMVARKLKATKEFLRELALGCLLHDLGLRYITVSYINLDMEKRLASEVFEFKKHTIQAYSALEGESWIGSNAKRMILSHHERKDGSGFPLRQKSRELNCNILQACDIFDCAISGVECKRITIQEALQYLMETADVLFEKRIVRILVNLIGRYPVGQRLRLTSGESGVVLEQTEHSIYPVIGVLDEKGRLTGKSYRLKKDDKLSILQLES